VSTLVAAEAIDILLRLPPHRMTNREQGEHDGWFRLAHRHLGRGKTAQAAYDIGYAWGAEAAKRRDAIRTAGRRDSAIRDAAPSAWERLHPAGSERSALIRRSS